MTLEQWLISHLIFGLWFGWAAYRNRKLNPTHKMVWIGLLSICAVDCSIGLVFPEYRIYYFAGF
jgi:uncharacterized membrane protein